MKRRGLTGAELFMLGGFLILIFALALFGFAKSKDYSRDNTRISDLKQIANALTLYFDANGRFPAGCEWSTEPCWPDFLAPHIDPVPKDPINRASNDCEKDERCLVYRYCRVGEGRSFVVTANLEKPKKQPMAPHPSCPLGGPNLYWVAN